MADFQGALDSVRDELFLDTATGSHLDAIGGNHGLARPRADIDDGTWRRVLRVALVAPKTVRERFEALLAATVGGVLSIDASGAPAGTRPTLRVEVRLDAASGGRPRPPAVTVRVSGPGLPADAPRGSLPGTVVIDRSGVQVGTPGSPTATPAPGPELVVDGATAGQTEARLRFAPVHPSSVELWVDPRTPAVPGPLLLSPAHYAVDVSGHITFDVLPAPLTFLAPVPGGGLPLARPGVPPGAQVLATYRIDTRTYAGLAAALRFKLPAIFRIEVAAGSLDAGWAHLDGLDAELGERTRIDLRSWAVHDVGRARGPDTDEPTTPFLDRHTPGPRVFVDLRRRPDLTETAGRPGRASYVHEDFVHPAPAARPDRTPDDGQPWRLPPVPPPGSEPAPQTWAVHPWNANGDRDRVRGDDPAFRGPYLYTFDERLQPHGRETRPGDPTSWEPFAREFVTLLAPNPRTGQDEPVVVRQDREARNPFTGAPLENVAVPRGFAPRPDRSDHPLVLFRGDVALTRLQALVDLVRAAGVFVTFERAERPASPAAPTWFCDPCHATRQYEP